MTLSEATIPDQSGTGSNGTEGVLHIPQSSKIGASPSNGLMSYPGEMQSVYPRDPGNWGVEVLE